MMKTAHIARSQAKPWRPTYANRVGGGREGLVHLPVVSLPVMSEGCPDRLFGSSSQEAITP